MCRGLADQGKRNGKLEGCISQCKPSQEQSQKEEPPILSCETQYGPVKDTSEKDGVFPQAKTKLKNEQNLLSKIEDFPIGTNSRMIWPSSSFLSSHLVGK